MLKPSFRQILVPGVLLLAGAVASGGEGPGRDEKVIVHLGDSITSTIYLGPDEKIDRVLQRRLVKARPGTAFRNVNLGLDGEWIESFLEKRYDRVLRRRVKRADVFVIRYGANDAQKGKTPEKFTRDLAALTHRLEKDYPGCRIVLGTGPHIAKLPWCNKHQYGPNWQAIRDFGRAKGYPVVDVYKLFEARHASGAVLGKKNNPKDMHPNCAGVELTADALARAIMGLTSDGPTRGAAPPPPPPPPPTGSPGGEEQAPPPQGGSPHGVLGRSRAVAHKGGQGMAVPFPDVCKTPTPAGPVPIPYPNLDKSSDTSKGSKSVKVDGKMMTAKGATFSTSEGDEPGTAGPGVKAAEGGMLKLITPDAPQPRLPAREAPEPPSPEDRKAELLRLLAPSAEE